MRIELGINFPVRHFERITTPWEADLYRHSIANEVAYCARVVHGVDGSLIHSDAFNKKVGHLIHQASVVLWKEDLRKAATNGYKLFVGRPFEVALIKFQPQFWVYELDIDIGYAEDSLLVEADDIQAKRNGLLPKWYGIAAVLISQYSGIETAITVMQPNIHEMPEDIVQKAKSTFARSGFAEEIAPRLVVIELNQKVSNSPWSATIAAQLEFMNLEIIDVESVHHSRQMRRAAERDNMKLPDLRVVTLRKKRTEGSTVQSGSEVEWSCQWLVGAHWRNQWFPKSGEHRPVYIMPYIKGPDHKPFRQNNAEKIFVVAR